MSTSRKVQIIKHASRTEVLVNGKTAGFVTNFKGAHGWAVTGPAANDNGYETFREAVNAVAAAAK